MPKFIQWKLQLGSRMTLSVDMNQNIHSWKKKDQQLCVIACRMVEKRGILYIFSRKARPTYII